MQQPHLPSPSLRNYVDITPKSFWAANKQSFSAVGKGELIMDVPNGVDSLQLCLTEVLYSPEVGYTLVSVGRLDEMGFSLTFGGGKCVICAPDGSKIREIPKSERGLYRATHEGEDTAAAAVEELTLDQLHRRLGHISPATARRLVEKGVVTGIRLEEEASGDFFCKSCIYAKATCKSIPKVREGKRAKAAPVATKGGRRYWITFVDFSRFTILNLLQTKDGAFNVYHDLDAWYDTQFGTKIKVLHSDQGGEYKDQAFQGFLRSRGTEQKFTVHDTQLQNASGLPKMLWGEAARHAVWLMNCTPMKALDGKTPFEAVWDKKPDFSQVWEWGGKVYVRVEAGDKLGGRVREGRWLGVDEQAKGVRVYWPDMRTVTVERNTYFDKAPSASRVGGEDMPVRVETRVDDPATAPPPSTKNPTTATSINNDAEAKSDQTAATPCRCRVAQPPASAPAPPFVEQCSQHVRAPSTRIQQILDGHGVASHWHRDGPIARGVQLPPAPELAPEPKELEGEGEGDWMMFFDHELDEYAMAAEMGDSEALEPRSLAEAMCRPDWPLWKKAIHEELAVLREAGTWELVEAPEDANIVGSKCAQGFSQVPGHQGRLPQRRTHRSRTHLHAPAPWLPFSRAPQARLSPPENALQPEAVGPPLVPEAG